VLSAEAATIVCGLVAALAWARVTLAVDCCPGVFLRERTTRSHVLGIVLAVVAIVLIASGSA
jgi:uncharacterized membrane protein